MVSFLRIKKTSTTLEQELAKISGLNKQVKESIAKAARAKEDLKKVLLSGKLYMAIAPLTQLKLRAIVAAYYLAKRGVLEFHLYLKELKVLQIIADSENLSAEQKLIFKQAYRKGVELAEKDGKLATEIEEAMAKGDFEKLEYLAGLKKNDIDVSKLKWWSSNYKNGKHLRDSFKNSWAKGLSWDEIVKATKTKDAIYKGTMEEVRALETEALKNGTLVPLNKGVKNFIYKDINVIGASLGEETKWLRVEVTADGAFHGHPITSADAASYLKKSNIE